MGETRVPASGTDVTLGIAANTTPQVVQAGAASYACVSGRRTQISYNEDHSPALSNGPIESYIIRDYGNFA